jgi:hypothetical protein
VSDVESSARIRAIALAAIDEDSHPDLSGGDVDGLIIALQRARREAFGPPPPSAAVIEILEPNHATEDTMGGSLIIPREVRINGVSLLTPQGGIKVHEMSIDAPKEAVQVTVTLFARRVTIAAEGDLQPAEHG